MGLIKEVFKYFNKNPTPKKLGKDRIIGWNIIKNDMSVKEYKKRFKTFHKSFKYKFLVPIVLVGHKILSKWIFTKNDIDDESHNVLIKNWCDTFELTLKEWCLHYRNIDIYKADYDYRKDKSVDLLRKMNDFLVTGYMYDTAYRIFFDMLSTNWVIKCGEIFPDKIGNVIYNRKTINDLEFWKITGNNADDILLDQGDHMLFIKSKDGIRIDKLDMKSGKVGKKINKLVVK